MTMPAECRRWPTSGPRSTGWTASSWRSSRADRLHRPRGRDQGTAADAGADHARVEEVVANVRREAAVHGLPPDLIEKLWRRLIDWSIAREEGVLGPNGGPEEGEA